MKEQLNEILPAKTPAEQAHALGLEYGGFGGWIDPVTRDVLARTIDGKLVRVDDSEEQEVEEDLGRLILLDFDDELMYIDAEKAKTGNYPKMITLIKAIVKTGNDTIIMHSRNSAENVAEFLHNIGVTSGPKLVPIGSSESDKKKEFVEKKVKAGYREIQFFDRDAKAIHAVESLKPKYNRLEIKVDTHKIPSLSYDPKTRPTADFEREV